MLIDLPKRALDLATYAHEGQKRRDKVTPYITHPMRVGVRFSDPLLQAVGYLHDVLEDTPADRRIFSFFGIPDPVYYAVLAMTKIPGENYANYLVRVKFNHAARTIKIADIDDNLSDTPTAKQRTKYSLALAFLRTGDAWNASALESLKTAFHA